MNYPKADTGYIYPEMSKYIDSNGFTFDHEKESFPKSKRAFINGEDFEGKLIDYLKDSPYWEDDSAEWIYCIAYDGHIVKIGMSLSSLKKRYASYSCGTRKAMKKGSCSTTNYVITESNYNGITEGMKVEIYGIRIEKKYVTEERFKRTFTMETLRGRGYEEWVTNIFVETTGHIPILCVQKGNSTK